MKGDAFPATTQTIREARRTKEAWGHALIGKGCSDTCRLCALLDAAEIGLRSVGRPDAVRDAIEIVRAGGATSE